MGQLGAGLAYLAAILLWVLLVLVYVPVLTVLGVPTQVAATAVGVGALVVLAAVVARAVGLLPADKTV